MTPVDLDATIAQGASRAICALNGASDMLFDSDCKLTPEDMLFVLSQLNEANRLLGWIASMAEANVAAANQKPDYTGGLRVVR